MPDDVAKPHQGLRQQSFLVGNWTVDPLLNSVSLGTQSTRLEPKTMQVLVCLAGRAGDVVPKEDLIRAVWPDAFVTDQVLTTAIYQLRQAFGEDAQSSRFIQTIPKGGYRLKAKVVPVSSSISETENLTTPVVPQRHSWRRVLAYGVPALALLMALAIYFWPRRSPTPAKQQSILAVLPFDNLSGDPSQEYFSDGMTEEMIQQLGVLDPPRLSVIARASVMTYKGSGKRVDQIGKELGVDYVLEGSVRREGGRVRVTAQLIDARTQTQVWGQNYDQDWRDTLLVQTDIARATAQQIRLQLTPAQQARLAGARVVHSEAYELYLKGRFGRTYRSIADAERSIAYFRQAVDLDPTFAAAHAGLALAHVNRHSAHFAARPGQGYEEAKVAAQRALELDPALPEAHIAVGAVANEFEWDWAAAEQEFLRALQLNPNSEDGHRRYAELLMCTGRLSAAIAEIEEARKLDPLSTVTIGRAAFTYFFARDYSRSIAESEKALATDPGDFLPYGYLAWAYGEQGRHAEALAAAQKGAARTTQLDTQLNVARAYIMAGQVARGRELLQEVQAAPPARGYFHLYYVAMVHANLGEKESALDYLERSFQRRERAMKIIKVDPRFDLLRGEPRFQTLVRRMNFPG